LPYLGGGFYHDGWLGAPGKERASPSVLALEAFWPHGTGWRWPGLGLAGIGPADGRLSLCKSTTPLDKPGDSAGQMSPANFPQN